MDAMNAIDEISCFPFYSSFVLIVNDFVSIRFPAPPKYQRILFYCFVSAPFGELSIGGGFFDARLLSSTFIANVSREVMLAAAGGQNGSTRMQRDAVAAIVM